LNSGREATLVELIRGECEAALSFIEGIGRDRFLSDTLIQHAVAMCLIAVGEYVVKLLRTHPEFSTANPDIPFDAIVGMRNRIAHGYYGLDFEVVWDTLQGSVPDLLDKLPAGNPMDN
jgi:uncharacterized protein with HEPN domain